MWDMLVQFMRKPRWELRHPLDRVIDEERQRELRDAFEVRASLSRVRPRHASRLRGDVNTVLERWGSSSMILSRKMSGEKVKS